MVVIGGGIIGCSTAYHLAKLGKRDVVLVERSKLGCGTTWHSAAMVRQLRSTNSLTQLAKYSSQLYQSLEAETGQSTGWMSCGSLSIATTPDRLTHIRRQASLAACLGIEVHEVDRAKVADLGLDLATVGRELGTLLGGGYVNRFNYFDRSYKVIPQIGEEDRATVGPLLEKEIGGRSVATLNLRFSRHIGSNAESGTEFSYAARWKYNLHPLYEPAIEFFGEPGRIGHLPSTQQQPHWLGPAVYGKAKLGAGHAFVYSAALLFGYTDAASDKRLVLRAEYEF